MTKLTPQELASACAASMWEQDACSRALGMSLVSVAPGSATLQMTVRADMCNGQNICHGGLMFTLADSAFAFACNAYNQFAVAQHCSVSFLKPVYENQLLTATACERFREGRAGIYDVVITRDDNDVVAEFRGLSRTVKGQHLPDQPVFAAQPSSGSPPTSGKHKQ